MGEARANSRVLVVDCCFDDIHHAVDRRLQGPGRRSGGRGLGGSPRNRAFVLSSPLWGAP
ncbi:hypothetical protein AB0C96_26425 [Streptomyces sp. NPDC048506]|uniref:hypothetical protein n=1 Tax=Streptomyces sp. NPDC048506 TaxID=3155028 RepID=UPI0034145AEB